MSRYKKTARKKAQPPRWLGLGLVTGVILIGGALWVLFGQSPTAAIQVTGRPSLQVNQETIDLGNQKLGNTVQAAFELTNVGDQPLRFTEAPYLEVVEGCWPPTPTIGAMVLQPGETTVLSMQFMMHGDMGGPHHFRVQLSTNDSTQTPETLTVLSNWVP